MIISLIAAASENNVIGKDNKLVWKLPNDMKFFKNTTWGMPVIMGRKTYDSMNGEPLPGRINIVITRKKDWKPKEEKTRVASNLTEALKLAQESDCKEAFVIGGGQIYLEAIDIADKIYLTRVHTIIDGDTFFPIIDEQKWEKVSNLDFASDDKHAYSYSIEIWETKK